ncbi:MAG: DUF3298 domain-containing protein [Reyranella sp.]|nr:DUF3298 domain-containing protein [Reyranella sp.]
MRRLLATAVLLAVVEAAPAQAQSGPSFDCAKASIPVERTICKSAELAKADRNVASVYAALASKLSGGAKDHLVKDQQRWIGNRNRACIGEDAAECLKSRYENRLALLKEFGTGAYPFVSEQAIVRAGKVKATRYRIDASYPQFDGPAINFTALNTKLANMAKEAAGESVPAADIGDDIEQTWSYEQSFGLHRPGPAAISVEMSSYSFTGGAHGNGSTYVVLVDLRTGRDLKPENAFTAGGEWLRTVTAIVAADLKKQFVERPGFDDALEPAKLAELMAEPGRYLFKADGLEIIFNPYDVGPYSAGTYQVAIPYSRLRTLIRADGPIAR